MAWAALCGTDDSQGSPGRDWAASVRYGGLPDNAGWLASAGARGDGSALRPSARPIGAQLSRGTGLEPVPVSTGQAREHSCSPGDAGQRPAPRLSGSRWPHARAKPYRALRPYARGVCAWRTATKYRNTTTASRYPAGLGTVLACSRTNMVAVARSSGRRGRRFKSCHPDCIPAGQRPAPEMVRASLLPVQQQNTASTATTTRFDLRLERAPPACAALRK